MKKNIEITEEQILRAAPHTDKKHLREFIPVFNGWAERFDINTPLRMVHFLAQCWHESCALKYLEELASGEAYDTGRLAARLGNTPASDGDGQRFKGRGIIQLTGRKNYQAYADCGYCSGDLMSHPEWLAKSPGAYKSAMWFWKTNGCNQLADNGDVEALTRRINGGLNGLAQRKFYLGCFKKEFGL